MLYRSDAHHYRALIKRKQRRQRLSGFLLLILSTALMFYAIPGFATSVFDYDDQVVGSIAFSQSVNDHESVAPAAKKQAATEATAGGAAVEAVSTANTIIMSETVGPALLADESAVNSAIKRAQALQVVTSTQNTMVTAKAISETPVEQHSDRNIVAAVIAFAIALVCAILGLRMIMHSRQMLGRRIAAAYGSALRAC